MTNNKSVLLACAIMGQLATIPMTALANDNPTVPPDATLTSSQANESFDSAVFIKSAKSPLTARLNTVIDGKTAQQGDRFEAVLTQPYVYNGQQLPEKTVFTGKIHKVDHSKHFARPGYVVLDVESAQLPSGMVFLLDKNRFDTRERHLHHPHATTAVKKLVSTAGFAAVSLATSLPLRFATDLGGLVTTPISFGSKMIYGSALELSKHDGRSTGNRVAYGIFRGTGIPGTYHLIHPSPEVQFAHGGDIKLYLDPEALQALFSFSDPAPAKQEALKNLDEMNSDKPTLLLEQAE